MAYRDLQEYLLRLEQSRELYRYQRPVASAHVAAMQAENHKKALIFENIKDAPWPVVINLMGSERRTAWALGVDALDDLNVRARLLFDISFPLKISELMGRFTDVMGLLRTPPAAKGPAPVQALTVPDFDVTRIPHLEADGHGYVPQGLLFVQQGEMLHVQTVRVYMSDAETLEVLLDGRALDSPCAAALIFGDDPSLMWAASLQMPRHITPLMLAGWLRGRPITLVPARSSETLRIPAHAEIVLEGELSPHQTDASRAIFKRTLLTQRVEAVYPLYTGSRWPSKAAERLMLPVVSLIADGVCDLSLSDQVAIVSVNPMPRAQAQRILFTLWALDATARAGGVVLVDAGINVHDRAEVARAMRDYASASSDILRVENGQGGLKWGIIALSQDSPPAQNQLGASLASLEEALLLLTSEKHV